MTIPTSERDQEAGASLASRADGHGSALNGGGLSLLPLVNVLLSRRRLIIAFTLVGFGVGFLFGFLSNHTYTSGAKFLPQANENAASSADLAAAASQFGIRLPGSTGAWNPAVYVDLVRSTDLLAPMVSEPLEVREQGRRASLIDLWEVKGRSPGERVERAVAHLQSDVDSREARAAGAVEFSVSTRWPSVSYQLTSRILEAVHRFNLNARSSQAAAEATFMGPLVEQSRDSLQSAESRLVGFLEHNRELSSSPELAFERDRLQREVAMRQQLYTSMLQKYEEALIGERRNTPVITILEWPRLPVLPDARHSVLKGSVGALAGALLALAIALLSHGLSSARQRADPEASQFFDLVNEATPGLIRRRVFR